MLNRACIVIMAREYVPFYPLHGEVPRERGPFLKPQVYKRKEISLVEVYERVAVSPCRSFQTFVSECHLSLFYKVRVSS